MVTRVVRDSECLSRRSTESNEKVTDAHDEPLPMIMVKHNSRGKSAVVRRSNATNFHENFKDLNPEYALARRERVLRCAKNYLKRIGEWLKAQVKAKMREIFN